uniref:Uncharacterized protein n=1 Tax=Arundo donax TaxID=35708 RepID=A0A0A9DXW3_ARUDO
MDYCDIISLFRYDLCLVCFLLFGSSDYGQLNYQYTNVVMLNIVSSICFSSIDLTHFFVICARKIYILFFNFSRIAHEQIICVKILTDSCLMKILPLFFFSIAIALISCVALGTNLLQKIIW